MEARIVNVDSSATDRRVDVLGVQVNVLNVHQACEIIEGWIRQRAKRYVCITGAHGVMESHRDERLRSILNQAGMVTADGMPLVWFSRFIRKAPARRVYGPDLMRALTAISPARGYRHFYYGGPPGIVEKLKTKMEHDHPGIEVVGTVTPPFRQLTRAEDDAVVQCINAARPDIVWVGLSTPKQEVWMARHVERIDAPVLIGVGAAFDFLAGTKRQAPRWMQRSGLEWFFRLATEPRRLWRRYAYIVPGFALLSARELVKHWLRRHPEETNSSGSNEVSLRVDAP
jgi:N-acetylglucosaminyldiphosphoundecaprenol N-acetyl-beta-D-mannosaminyltransferase